MLGLQGVPSWPTVSFWYQVKGLARIRDYERLGLENMEEYGRLVRVRIRESERLGLGLELEGYG